MFQDIDLNNNMTMQAPTTQPALEGLQTTTICNPIIAVNYHVLHAAVGLNAMHVCSSHARLLLVPRFWNALPIPGLVCRSIPRLKRREREIERERERESQK